MNAARRAVVGLVGIMGAACGGRAPDVTPKACVAVQGALAGALDAVRLVGRYQLSLTVTRGVPAGQMFAGELSLHASGDGVVGTARLPVQEMGAQGTGNLASDDPAAPGARVVDGGDILIVRLGADANRAGQNAIEGPYLALYVRRIDEAGFAGTWASGAERPDVEGYFCAIQS